MAKEIPLTMHSEFHESQPFGDSTLEFDARSLKLVSVAVNNIIEFKFKFRET